MENRVTVLMSTYNGSRYLKRQLQSILSQDYVGHITILIRDDASSDGTVTLIKQMRQDLENEKKTNLVARFRSIRLLRGENHGPQDSFLQLIRIAPESAYYFFADQDDLWDENYISYAVNKLKQKKEDEPSLYCSNYRLVDAGENVLEQFAIRQVPNFTPLKMLFYNQIPGCCMGMNAALMEKLKEMQLQHVMMHDSFTLSYACFAGNVIYDGNAFVNHRIHGDNVVGIGHKKIVWKSWFKEKFSLLLHREKYDVSEMAQQFLTVTENATSREYYCDILLLSKYKRNYFRTVRLLLHKDTFDVPFDRTTMSIRMKILLHLF